MLDRLSNWWKELKLVRKFFFAGSIVMMSGIVTTGMWISDRIEHSVTENTAVSTALYMDSFVAPLVQELSRGKRLTRRHRRALDRLLNKTPLGKRIVSIKIWKKDGYIAYSSRPSLIGKTFSLTENLKRAWTGVITAEYNSLVDEEDALERAVQIPLLEMYAPIRARNSETGEIIAVAEFYENAERLSADLWNARIQAWLLVASVWIATYLILFLIVRQGGQIIDAQRQSLEQRIQELSHLLEQNDQLRIRVEHAYRQAGELNEHFLKNIGADLHDGPAQLLSLALLRLEELNPRGQRNGKTSATAEKNFQVVASSLSEALAEIRNISSDLVTPDLDQMSLTKMIETAIESHEKRTGTQVDSEISLETADVPKAAKINIYRFVQECLTNSFKHAGGKRQKIVARSRNGHLTVQVSDKGPGFAPDKSTLPSGGLGLVGMRNRIESIMGKFDVKSGPEMGTCVTAKIDLAKLEDQNVGQD